MKVCLITQHYAPHFEGGTEAVVRAQARELARRGHAVSIVSGTDRPHAGKDVLWERVDGVPVAFLPRLPHEAYDLELERPRLAPLIRELVRGAELVHMHHWSTLTGSLARDLARERPVVVTLHDLFVTCPRFFRVPVAPVERSPEPGDFEPCARCIAVDAPGIPLDDLRERLERRAERYQGELAAAAAMVVPSRAHAETLRRYVALPPEKLALVPHGLLRTFDQRPVLRWTGEGQLQVLSLGHRAEVKGARDLVRALAALSSAERGRIELLFLGGEVERGFDESLRQEGRGLALRFDGTYPPEELAARLEQFGGAHLAAFPSRVAESYGLVVDEALALGFPVWVSDRGAPKERVGRAGRVLPAEDPAAWTRALREVLAAPDMLEAERAAVPEKLRTAADAAQELEELYLKLVAAAS